MSYNFFIIGGDKRILHLAQELKNDGNNVKLFGFDKVFYNDENKANKWDLKNASINEINEKETKEMINKANENDINELIYEENGFKQAKSLSEIQRDDIIISSIPLTMDGKNVYSPFSNNSIKINDLEKIIKNHIFFAGKIPKTMKENNFQISAKLNENYDVLEDEKLTILNTIPTAEGAIAKAINETDITIDGANILVLGFGRVGKMLAYKLKALNANVYVEARKEQDLAWIKALGYNEIPINELNDNLCKMDVIFNTIPSLILDKEKLILLNKKILIIDLASKPGGVDFETCKKLKFNASLYSRNTRKGCI